MKNNLTRWLHHSNFSTVLLMIIGLIIIFALLVIQPELIKMSKSAVSLDDNTFLGRFQYFLSNLRDWYLALPVYARELFWALHRNYLFFIVPFILVLEYLYPSQPEQRLFSIGFRQDTAWFVVRLLLDPFLLGASFIFYKTVYEEHLSFLTIQTTATSWPIPFQILLVVALSDFITWICHVVIHKFSIPWAFHAVHHSQEQMNMFTGDRAHPVDILFQRAMICTLLLIFQVPLLPSLPAIWVFMALWQRFTHANVKIDFGIFNYILVSPQFHRIHHSKEDLHRDKNFGSFFSIWDHLFGTAYRSTSEYPATGVTDPAFPYEGRIKKSLLFSICLQIIYPFEQLFRNGVKTSRKIFKTAKYFLALVPISR